MTQGMKRLLFLAWTTEVDVLFFPQFAPLVDCRCVSTFIYLKVMICFPWLYNVFLLHYVLMCIAPGGLMAARILQSKHAFALLWHQEYEACRQFSEFVV